MSKFKAVPTEVDGIVFHSKKEAGRYLELKILERIGQIRKLELQPEYQLTINGHKICKYRGDFRYSTGTKMVVEDVKGIKTPVYQIKKKLMAALYGIYIVET